MFIEEAFRIALARFREEHAELLDTFSGRRCAVWAQERFEKASKGKEDDPRFPTQGPKYAYFILVESFYHWLKGPYFADRP